MAYRVRFGSIEVEVPSFDEAQALALRFRRREHERNRRQERRQMTDAKALAVLRLIAAANPLDGVGSKEVARAADMQFLRGLGGTAQFLRKRLQDFGVDPEVAFTHRRTRNGYRWMPGPAIHQVIAALEAELTRQVPATTTTEAAA